MALKLEPAGERSSDGADILESTDVVNIRDSSLSLITGKSVLIRGYRLPLPSNVPCEVRLASGRPVMTHLQASLAVRHQQVYVGSVARPVLRWYPQAVFKHVSTTTSDLLVVTVDLGLGQESEQQLRPIRGALRRKVAPNGKYTLPEHVGDKLIGHNGKPGQLLSARIHDRSRSKVQQLPVKTHKPAVVAQDRRRYAVTGLDPVFDQQQQERFITGYSCTAKPPTLHVYVHCPQVQDKARTALAGSRLTWASQPPPGAAPVYKLHSGAAIVTSASYFKDHLGYVPTRQRLPCEVLLQGHIVISGFEALVYINQGLGTDKIAVGDAAAVIDSWCPGAQVQGVRVGHSGSNDGYEQRPSAHHSACVQSVQVIITSASASSSAATSSVAAPPTPIHGPLRVDKHAVAGDIYTLPADLCHGRPQFDIHRCQQAFVDVRDSSGAPLLPDLAISQYKPNVCGTKVCKALYRVRGLGAIWDHYPDAHITGYELHPDSSKPPDSRKLLRVYVHRGAAPLTAGSTQQQQQQQQGPGQQAAEVGPAAAVELSPPPAPPPQAAATPPATGAARKRSRAAEGAAGSKGSRGSKRAKTGAAQREQQQAGAAAAAAASPQHHSGMPPAGPPAAAAGKQQTRKGDGRQAGQHSSSKHAPAPAPAAANRQPSQPASVLVLLARLVAALLHHGTGGSLPLASAQQQLQQGSKVEPLLAACVVGAGVAAGVLQRGQQQQQQQQQQAVVAVPSAVMKAYGSGGEEQAAAAAVVRSSPGPAASSRPQAGVAGSMDAARSERRLAAYAVWRLARKGGRCSSRQKFTKRLACLSGQRRGAVSALLADLQAGGVLASRAGGKGLRLVGWRRA